MFPSVSARRAQYCRRCQCHVICRWNEPHHGWHSALTLAMSGAQAVTPVTGLLMLGVWLQRIAQTRRWGCPHCRRPAQAA